LEEIPFRFRDLVERDDVLRRSGGSGRVSGTHEAPVPIVVDAVDLTLPPRVVHLANPPADTQPSLPCRFCWRFHPSGSYVHEAPPPASYGDQAGQLSVAAVLDSWVRDWRGIRKAGEGLPEPSVPVLAQWLANRVEWACDEHPAVDEFAEEMRGLRSALYGALGLFDVPDYKRGVPCRNPQCDALNLVQKSGSKYVECLSCGRLLSESEYAEWTQTVSGHFRSMRRRAG